MNKTFIVIFLGAIFFNCTEPSIQKVNKVDKIPLTLEKAKHLYHFAYECIDREYPYKLGQVLSNKSQLKTPRELHPTFYGCFDWHSSVHGHWTLINILKYFPNFQWKDNILKKIGKNITKENIEKEIAYFNDRYNKNFERTYGWAWLLKLAEVLNEWQYPKAKEWAENLKPLTNLIAQKFINFLNKLNYPIRVGEHPNTAFGMSFAIDYAKKYNTELYQTIKDRAKHFYTNDINCPLTWEPGGFDFLSPCLQEASLMNKILPKTDFIEWLDKFLPNFRKKPSKFIKAAEVVDKSDGKMAHLDGLNFSRAWCLYQIGKTLENPKMIDLANTHFKFSYSKMDSGEYMGSHWLASFALYTLLVQ